MSIGKQVFEAINKIGAGDPVGALFAICAAVEATAKMELGKSGKKSYKEFIHNNLAIITDVAFSGRRILNINLAIDHPELKKNVDGVYSIEDIFYHVVRCGLYHEAKLPDNLEFTDVNIIQAKDGRLRLPASLVNGLIVAVIVAPVNNDENLAELRICHFRGFPLPFNTLWGRRTEFVWLLDVFKEMGRLQREAEASDPNGSRAAISSASSYQSH